MNVSVSFSLSISQSLSLSVCPSVSVFVCVCICVTGLLWHCLYDCLLNDSTGLQDKVNNMLNWLLLDMLDCCLIGYLLQHRVATIRAINCLLCYVSHYRLCTHICYIDTPLHNKLRIPSTGIVFNEEATASTYVAIVQKTFVSSAVQWSIARLAIRWKRKRKRKTITSDPFYNIIN